MLDRVLQQVRDREHYDMRIVVLLLCGVLFGGYGVYALSGQWGATEDVVNEAQIATSTAATVLDASLPTQIRISSVDITATFEGPLGLQQSGEIEVPDSFDTVGWYKHGPTPGELGPSVVLGHVDSYEGPEIFYNLRDIEIGDRIEIDRADGSTAVFEVTRVRTVEQSDFPTLEVYGDIDHAGLRLITCSGTYDQGERRYSHNLIVFARLVET